MENLQKIPGFIATVSNSASVTPIISKKVSTLSDRELFKKCQLYGKNVRFWAKKFGALLPEVLKRGLYKKHKCYSIYEFSAKLAGMNKETVDEILRVSEKLSDKPLLQAQMEEQGWSKLRVVANIATKETEKFWVEKVKILPKKALEMYILEIKRERKNEMTDGRDVTERSGKKIFDDVENLLPGEEIRENDQKVKWAQMSFKIDPETKFRLRKFQQKLEKEKKQTVTFNEVLRKLLDQAEGTDKAENKKEVEEAETKLKQSIRTQSKQSQNLISRYISVKKRRTIENNGRCAHPSCHKPSTEIHHVDRFSIVKNHENIIPLCHEHHILAHAGQNMEDDTRSEREKGVDENFLRHLIQT